MIVFNFHSRQIFSSSNYRSVWNTIYREASESFPLDLKFPDNFKKVYVHPGFQLGSKQIHKKSLLLQIFVYLRHISVLMS
jgi:hypothetical protein